MYDLQTKGLFIAVEGIDGAGSSTFAANLGKTLNEYKTKTFVTKEPTDNLIGGLIRGALTHEWNPSPRTLQQLFAADRSHHLDRMVLPNLKKGFTVITDRYFFSTFAFGMLDVELKELISYNQAYPWPDIIFFLDIPVKETQARMGNSRDRLELFEKEDKQLQVRKNYRALAKRFSIRTTTLNALKSPGELIEEALPVVLNHPLIKSGKREQVERRTQLHGDPKRLWHGWEEVDETVS